MPGGFVCSGSFKAKLRHRRGQGSDARRRPDRGALQQEAARLLRDCAPDGISIDDLAILGPITVMKLKFSPDGYDGRMVAELWFYPDGSRILELSTKAATTDAFDVAARSRQFLEHRGVNLSGEQQTKTKTALEYFSSELR